MPSSFHILDESSLPDLHRVGVVSRDEQVWEREDRSDIFCTPVTTLTHPTATSSGCTPSSAVCGAVIRKRTRSLCGTCSSSSCSCNTRTSASTLSSTPPAEPPSENVSSSCCPPRSGPAAAGAPTLNGTSRRNTSTLVVCVVSLPFQVPISAWKWSFFTGWLVLHSAARARGYSCPSSLTAMVYNSFVGNKGGGKPQ